MSRQTNDKLAQRVQLITAITALLTAIATLIEVALRVFN